MYLLDLYLSKLPSIAFEKDVLYWKPKNDIPKSSKEPWYHCQPVGKHKLSGMVVQMCEETGLSERKTNHSLCVTGATSLYKGSVRSSRELVTVRSKHLGSMSALQKSSTRLFQVCFLHLWNCFTRFIWSLFVAQVYQVTHSNLVVFHYPKYALLFRIMVQVFHHIL